MVNAAQWQLLVNEINTIKYLSLALLKVREKYRENVKIWGHIIHWRPPTPNSGGRVPPSPKVYACGHGGSCSTQRHNIASAELSLLVHSALFDLGDSMIRG